MSFQENKKTEKNKLPLQQHFIFHAFHPKAVNLVVFGRSSDSPPFEPPSHSNTIRTVDVVAQKWPQVGGGITATGIVTGLHRTSLLIICLRQVNQVQGKCKGRELIVALIL